MKHLLPWEIKRKLYKRKSNFLRVKYELVFTDINIAKIKVTVSINIACLETTNNNSAIKILFFYFYQEDLYLLLENKPLSGKVNSGEKLFV